MCYLLVRLCVPQYERKTTTPVLSPRAYLTLGPPSILFLTHPKFSTPHNCTTLHSHFIPIHATSFHRTDTLPPPPPEPLLANANQSFKEEKSSSSSVSSLARPSRWSLSSTHSSLPASAPRSVWVPGKDGLKGTSPVDFSLPSWAGVRTTCGCLSLTELTLGKEGLTVAALTDISNVMMVSCSRRFFKQGGGR